MHTLTDRQKDFLRWVVAQIDRGKLKETFTVQILTDDIFFVEVLSGAPQISRAVFDIYHDLGLLVCKPELERTRSVEVGLVCTVTGLTYQAVRSDFQLPLPHSSAPRLQPWSMGMHVDGQVGEVVTGDFVGGNKTTNIVNYLGDGTLRVNRIQSEILYLLYGPEGGTADRPQTVSSITDRLDESYADIEEDCRTLEGLGLVSFLASEDAALRVQLTKQGRGAARNLRR